jgi:nucleoside-diphosphate-sugar epimerase
VTSHAPGATPAVAEGRGELRDRFAGEVVLVTGFPGYRARALVELLVEREPSAELWLVVPPAQLEEATRLLAEVKAPREQLRLIPGEPCAIDLGLSRETYAELVARVDRWFPLYQTTDARASRELCFRVNLGSAREVVELSRVAVSLSHVVFLSSSIVFGDHGAAVDESRLEVGQAFRNPAGESLASAERLLQRRLAEAPVSVVRTPPVLGSQRAGGAPRSSGLHRLLAHVKNAPGDVALPLPPGAHRPVQTLPADFVALALYAVSELGTRGHAYHFTDPRPPSLGDVLERAAAHFGKRFEHGFDARALGRLLLKSPAFWLSQQSSWALSECTEATPLSTRSGDRLLERAGLHAPSLLDYLSGVLRETEELAAAGHLEERFASQPFEVVA